MAGETELLEKGKKHAGSLLAGGGLGGTAALAAVWMAVVQPMQDTNTRQWQEISDLKADMKVMQARMDTLQELLSEKWQ